MTGALYLAALLVSLVCVGLLDHRFRLVLWHDPRRAAVVLVVGVAFFLLWDVAAIASRHYRMGASEAMTGLVVAPELPVEELVFVTFLCYVTLVLRGLVALAVRSRADDGGAPLRGTTAGRRGSATGPGRPAAPARGSASTEARP